MRDSASTKDCVISTLAYSILWRVIKRKIKMDKILTAFCFTDIHNQQSMLDYPTTVRGSLVKAVELATEEFGKADVALVGGDNVSDYPLYFGS